VDRAHLDAAQERQAQEEPGAGGRVSPTGAFLRSVLLPGWGQAAAGAYTRAGFYVVAQSGTGWMLLKTLSRLRAARESQDFWEGQAEARLMAEGVTDPDSLALRVEEDPQVEDARSLVNSRSDQLEDWVALGVFLVLLGGADALVSAHLADFPEPLTVETGPGPEPNQVEIRVSVRLGPPGLSRKRAGP
jgi:hypothetical protein